jgi:hypothetical protein
MQSILATDRVRLTQDLPELELLRGAIGVVRGTWLYPNPAYEVEFPPPRPKARAHRLLLLDGQVAPEDSAERS